MVAASSTLSQRAQFILRTFRSAFAALDDVKSQPERQAVYDQIARHVQNASPMSFSALPDPVIAPLIESAPFARVEPVALLPETHVRRELADGAGYDLRVGEDGHLRLVFLDVTGDSAMHHFERKPAEVFRDDFSRVLAAMGPVR
jgi:hypothetical protein